MPGLAWCQVGHEESLNSSEIYQPHVFNLNFVDHVFVIKLLIIMCQHLPVKHVMIKLIRT